MSPKILLVEDDTSLREWVSYELEGDGYQVLLAADGLAGLNQAQTGPDLILMDVALPGLDGFKLGQKLQADPRTAGIPIIYLSARGRSQDKVAGLRAGGVSYLTKPFKIAELKASIQSLLNHNRLIHRESVAQIETAIAQAADLQRQLIPVNLPAVTGLDLFAHYQAATQVSGDFYDFSLRSDGRLVFTIADISGKGLSAAMMMSAIRLALRTAAYYSASPRAVLERVNADLYADLSDINKFVTVFVGFYEPQTGQIIYANMGHAPVIFTPFEGGAHLLAADGPPLGVLPQSFSGDHSLVLRPGDLLALASDGFNEAENPAGQMFGYERLLQTVDQLRRHGAKTIGNQLFSEISTFSTNCDQHDDQTLIILKGLERERT
jgi:sigma-B regulation protein RsbU (phosphoserine phosphatase)